MLISALGYPVPRNKLVTTVTLLTIAAAVATAPPASGQDSPIPPRHECEPYEPLGLAEEFPAEWTGPNDTYEYTVTVPEEAGGGIFQASVAGPPVGPRLSAFLTGAGRAANHVAQPGGTAEIAIEVGPGEEIRLVAASVRNAPADQYPITFRLKWIYEGRADCYEPNDNWQEAKAVPKDTEIEAFLVAKRGSNSHPYPQHDDWYKFIVDEPSEILIGMLEVPADVKTNMALLQDVGRPSPRQIKAINAPGIGETYALDAGLLEPGEYLLRIKAVNFLSGSAAAEGDEPHPPHFEETYEFRIVPVVQGEIEQPSPLPCVAGEAVGGGGGGGAQWTYPNDVNPEENFAAPGDPSGGVMEVTLLGPPVGPGLRVRIGGGPGATADDGADRGQTAKVAFEIGPGQGFFVLSRSVRHAPPPEYPVSYRTQWTYSGRPDCWEPNDTFEQAKPVPFDDDVEAYFIAKRDSNAHNHDQHDDWYRFTLIAPDEITVRLLTLPSDVQAGLGIYQPDGNRLRQIAAKGASAPGQTLVLNAGELPAGEYFLRASTASFASGMATAEGDEPHPPHFDTPYVFRVETGSGSE